jgi:NADH dehydrogenase
MGVEIHLGAMVTGVDERGIDSSATDPALRQIEAATKTWAAGVFAGIDDAAPVDAIIA